MSVLNLHEDERQKPENWIPGQGAPNKFWVKEPGGNTNQGPEAALSMMMHSLRKEASALLCEGVQGIFLNLSKFF